MTVRSLITALDKWATQVANAGQNDTHQAILGAIDADSAQTAHSTLEGMGWHRFQGAGGGLHNVVHSYKHPDHPGIIMVETDSRRNDTRPRGNVTDVDFELRDKNYRYPARNIPAGRLVAGGVSSGAVAASTKLGRKNKNSETAGVFSDRAQEADDPLDAAVLHREAAIWHHKAMVRHRNRANSLAVQGNHDLARQHDNAADKHLKAEYLHDNVAYGIEYNNLPEGVPLREDKLRRIRLGIGLKRGESRPE